MIITDKDSPNKVFSTYDEASEYAGKCIHWAILEHNTRYMAIEKKIIPFKMKDKMYWLVVAENEDTNLEKE